MLDQDLYARLGVALAIGLGVGIERGFRQRDEESGVRVAGLRTFTLLALLGAALGLSIQTLGAVFAAAAALGTAALLTAGYWRGLDRRDDHGLTTEVAAVLTLVTGALSGTGQLLAAALIGVSLMAVLHLKVPMHRLVDRIDALEISAALKLLVIALVLLPLLPDQGYGPGRVLNPRVLLWGVVVISALGFVAHVAMRALGGKGGALVLGLAGGMVSSTGVTLSAARFSRDSPQAGAGFAGAAAAAQGMMFLRLALLLAALNPGLFTVLVLPLAAGGLVALVFALVWLRKVAESGSSAAISATQPDQILSALQFVSIAAACLVLGHVAAQAGGWAGFLASAFVSGLADVDAAALLSAEAADKQVTLGMAANGVLLAVAANALTKAGLAIWFGTPMFAWQTGLMLTATTLVAGLSGVIAHWAAA